MSDRILLIGDAHHDLRSALSTASPAAQVVSVSTIFDGIAELANRDSPTPYTTVLAAAEPIERRPESAVRTLRELTGAGRLLLFGHPTLEPLSRKMLSFGVDDYLVTPTTAAELGQMLGGPSLRMVSSTDEERSPLLDDAPAAPAGRPLPLAGIPLAEVLLDALLLSPHDAPAAAVQQINGHIAPAMRLAFTAPGEALPAADGVLLLSHPVRAGSDDLGTVHLRCSSSTSDETTARHFLAQISHLIGRVASLQDRHNRLQKLAITDELTGLYNGRYFRHYLNRIVDKARTMRFPVTLLLFDIDNFKRYNDQYGHGVGDEILRQTAALMKQCVRDHDLVARISGDEFAVVFWEKEGPRQPRDPKLPPAVGTPGRPPQTPVQILERFRRLLSSHTYKGLGPAGQGTLTISGGLAVYPYDAHTVPDLIEAADRALMFKAKKSGKNSIYLVGGQPTAGSGEAPPTQAEQNRVGLDRGDTPRL